MKQINSHSSFQHSLLVSFLALFLFSCAGPGSKTTTDKSKTTALSSAEIVSAQGYLDRAQKSSGELAIALLLKASEQFYLEGNAEQALIISSKLIQLPLSTKQRYQLHLLQAKLLITEQTQLAAQQLTLAEQLISTENLETSTKTKLAHSADFYQLQTALYDQQDKPILAAEAALHFFNANDNESIINPALMSQTTPSAMWQRLSQLSSWQLSALANKQPPFIAGWQSLLTYSQKHSKHPTRLARYLAQWQRKYPLHPGQAIIDTIIANSQISPDEINNIAVLLPLSGKQKAIGQVIQEGILSAYNHKSGKTLSFFDSNSLDYASLTTVFTEQEIDYVIGPLLKNNVDKYLAQAELQMPTMLLNLPESGELAEHIVSLSMKPEDEAKQAATTLSQFDYQYPLVLTHNDATSKRIAKAFIKQWHNITGNEPELAYFDQGNKMQGQIKSSLDIDHSQLRTRRLSASIQPSFKIKNKRNRRDTDMIYAIGTPLQIKLVKPYIDVNVSPFADIIPIYANSRGHGARVDEATSRDLSELTFAEMPWLLNSKQQNKRLAQTAYQLWPTRSDSLQLFFAMGYDSYQLIDHIQRMQYAPYLRYFGQTGTFKLTDQTLTRSLLWGKYIKNKEKEITLD